MKSLVKIKPWKRIKLKAEGLRKVKYYKENLILISDAGVNTPKDQLNSGSIKIFNYELGKEIDNITSVKHPKNIELFNNNTIIVSELLYNKIFLLDLKRNEKTLFIENNNFINISSVKKFNNYIFISDIYAHKLFLYNIKGELIEEISLKPPYGYPIDLEIIDENVLAIIFFNVVKIPNKMYSQNYISEENVVIYNVKNKKIEKGKSFPFAISIAPTGIKKFNNKFWVLYDKYLYILNKKLEELVRMKIIKQFSKYSLFSIDINNKKTIFVVNKGVKKELIVLKIL